ncbi:hypothetical protein C0J52_03375 [Blattella germanica]|nr:hypothetical protein C0J52_03375 [Blattella germanica]
MFVLIPPEGTQHSIKMGNQGLKSESWPGSLHHCLLLIKMLLMKGCVEQNPGPPTKNNYPKQPGVADMSGELFEIKVAALLFMRGLRLTKSFYLASNLADAGVFDDIVFLYRQNDSDECTICFLQLKHKKLNGRRSLVNMKDILSIKGDFSLPKYYSSYCELKKQFGIDDEHPIFRENFDSCIFAIYTNAISHEVLRARPVIHTFGPKNILNSGGKVVSFNQYQNQCVSNYFEDLPRLRDFLDFLRNCEHKDVNVAEIIDNFSTNLSSELSIKLRRLRKELNTNEINRLIKDIDKVGDLSDYQEFLSNLYLFTSQASENDLNQLICYEISQLFCTSDKDTNVIFKQLIEKIQLWWKYENFYLSESAPFWWNIIQSRLRHINSAMKKELEMLGIGINNDCLQNIQSAIRTNRFLHVKADREILFLSNLKVYLAIMNERLDYIMVDTKYLLDHRKEILCLWPKKCKILVVCSDGCVQNLDKTWDLVFEFFRTDSENKIIVISSSSDQILDMSLKMKVKEHFTEVYDIFSFEHLSEESQNSFLYKTEVQFQGMPVSLQSILEDTEILTETIDAKTLVQLIKGGQSLTVGKQLASRSDYYIPRVLESCQYISTTILTANSSEFSGAIAVTGYNDRELGKFVPRGTKIEKLPMPKRSESNEVFGSIFNEEPTKIRNSPLFSSISDACSDLVENNKSLSLYIIKNEEEFHQLCQRYNDVHWFTKTEYNGTDMLKWVSSQGEINIIYQHLNTTSKRQYHHVDNVFGMDDRITLIVADAGMGKSTLLTHLSVGTKNINPETWVIKINLNDHTSQLQEVDPERCGTEQVFEFLCKTAKVKTYLERKLLEHCFYHTGNIVILLDGFDEISPTHAHKAGAILQCLCKTKVKKIWVTSRPIMKNFLEKLLSVFAFNLQPFTAEEQEKFMLNFWEKRLPNTSSNIEIFAKKLLDLSSKFLDSSFMGIPLQTMMLAEAYENHIKTDSYSELPESMDLLQLYDQFVEKKIHIYSMEKKKIDATKASFIEDSEYWHNIFFENHILASMVTLFPLSEYKDLYTHDAIMKINHFMVKIVEGHEKTGIINNVIDGKPQFIHRSFADYFVGKCLSILHQGNLDDTIYLSIKRYFISSNNMEDSKIKSVYETIFIADFTFARNIFDRFLAQGYPLHSALISGDEDLIIKLIYETKDVNIMDRGGRTPLHLAACYWKTVTRQTMETSETVDILAQLLLKGADINILDDVLNWRPLRYADKMKAWSAIENLLTINAPNEDLVDTRTDSSRWNSRQNVLYAALSKGLVELLKFVMQTKCNEEISYRHYEEYERFLLLRTAVQNEQWNILNMLIQKHIEINARLGEGHTILHWAARQGKPEAILELVRLGANVNITNDYGNTPLHCAAKSGSLSVVTMIVKLGGDVGIKNNDGDTALYLAAGQGMWHVVNHLLLLGSNINIGSNGNTPLHWAAEKGELDIIKHLVESRADINISNWEGNRPLHFAVRKCIIETVKVIIAVGADLNARNNHGETALHWAVWKGTPETIKVIGDLEADINIRNNRGETPLCWAAKQSQWDKVKLLLQYDADPNIGNSNGNVPLHWASKHGNSEIIKILAEYSPIDIRDNFGNTPMHFAAGSGRCDLIEQLHNLNADVNCTNDTGNTPLHFAIGEGREAASNLLMRLGANIEKKNAAQVAVIHLAAGQSRKEADERFCHINMIISGKEHNKLVYRYYCLYSICEARVNSGKVLRRE